MIFQPGTPSDIFDHAVPTAVSMIRIASMYVLVEAIMIALVGALRGAGDTHFTMLVSVITHWSFLPILYICLKVLSLSVSVSWFILVVFFLLSSLVLALRFRSGKWKTIKVING